MLYKTIKYNSIGNTKTYINLQNNDCNRIQYHLKIYIKTLYNTIQYYTIPYKKYKLIETETVKKA